MGSAPEAGEHTPGHNVTQNPPTQQRRNKSDMVELLEFLCKLVSPEKCLLFSAHFSS